MIDSCEKTQKWRSQSTTNKQGSSEENIHFPDNYFLSIPTEEHHVHNPDEFLSKIEREIQEQTRFVYEERLKFGVAKEQARKDLPVSNYTEMYAKTDLKNLLHFMGLRSDGHAQLEIRLYSDMICGMVKELFPITFEAWQDYHFNGRSFSQQEIRLLVHQMALQISPFDVQFIERISEFAQDLGMSKREIEEYVAKIKVDNVKDFDLSNKELYIKKDE